MRILARTSLALILAGAPLLALPPSATAEVTDCTYSKSKKLVTLTINNSDTTGWLMIERSLGTKKIGYRASGENWKGCEGATTDTTNKVKVVGSTLSEDIYLNLENGGFTPGATSESNGASEIEFDLDLGAGTDRVTLLGGRGSDRLGFVKAGQGTLNGDEDVDVTMTGVDVWRLDGGPGNDVLDGRGAPKVEVLGREGSDRLFGGPGRDSLYGDAGDEPSGDGSDLLNGGGGDDYLYGYRGSDTLIGGDGDDHLTGADNNDDVKGGAGNDDLVVEDSRDGADEFDGGSGADSLSYDDRSGD
ncbi:MAG TPA: calcium-binding protein, partial [Actinomycetes bacterium]|nr:calcium-binding protein [Actinomycetes bacterium]